MACHMQLLPSGWFDSAIEYLKTPLNRPFTDNFNKWLDYVISFYGNKEISIHGFKDRTNNCCEQYHSMLKEESKGIRNKFINSFKFSQSPF